MNAMKTSLKDRFVGNAIKFLDKQVIEASTKDCILLFFDEPEMPKELLDLQKDKSNK